MGLFEVFSEEALVNHWISLMERYTNCITCSRVMQPLQLFLGHRELYDTSLAVTNGRRQLALTRLCRRGTRRRYEWRIVSFTIHSFAPP